MADEKTPADEPTTPSATVTDCVQVQCTAIGPYQFGDIVSREALAAWSDPDKLIAAGLATASCGPPNRETVPVEDVTGGPALADRLATGEFQVKDLVAAHQDLLAAHAELQSDYSRGKAESEAKIAALTAAHEASVAELAALSASLGEREKAKADTGDLAGANRDLTAAYEELQAKYTDLHATHEASVAELASLTASLADAEKLIADQPPPHKGKSKH